MCVYIPYSAFFGGGEAVLSLLWYGTGQELWLRDFCMLQAQPKKWGGMSLEEGHCLDFTGGLQFGSRPVFQCRLREEEEGLSRIR